MIRTECPKCGAAVKAPNAAAGKRAKCPGCGRTIVVEKGPPSLVPVWGWIAIVAGAFLMVAAVVFILATIYAYEQGR